MASKDLGDVFSAIAGVGALASGVGAYNKSVADKAAYEMQATVQEQNSALATRQGQDAITRGQSQEFNSTLRQRQLKGQQIAQMAANGVSLSEGSPLNILADTDLMGMSDASIIRQNAMKEAWGYDVQAANAKNNASLLHYRASMESPALAAGTSLLTGAGKVASIWYRPSKGLGD